MIDTVGYLKRTIEHIHRVQSRGLELVDKVELSNYEKHQFLLNLSKHDQSKFSGIQLKAYPAMFNNVGKPTKQENDDFEDAWKDHYTKENHHPIGFNGKSASRIVCYEIACDLQAMSDEFKDNPKEYFDTKWKKENKQYIADSEWDDTCHNIEMALDCFRPNK